jgi:hypothetical protein
MHIITAIVRMLHVLEIDLGLPANYLVKKLTSRIHNLCTSLETKHTTMMRFSHQSIVHLFENLTTPNKKGQKQSPIVDASDMQKLMLNLPYLLDGLADDELRDFNRLRDVKDHVSDPIPAAIMAVNEWLHWYQLYRKEEPDEGDTERLAAMGQKLLTTLETVFPFKVIVGFKRILQPGERQTLRSMWCNEKIHSILHGPRNLMRMGRSKNFSCQVTELRHKGIKIKALKSNKNPASIGYSILYQELRDSALVNMAQYLDSDLNQTSWVVSKRRRLENGTAGAELEDQSDVEVLPAMRHFDREDSKEDKTSGCMGDGLRCNVWYRAQHVENMEVTLVKGWTAVKGARKGNLGLLMQEINWTEASGGTKPSILATHPFIAWIPNKVVHYLVDYHSEWLDPLDIPESNGEHNQLHTHHFQSVLKCLEKMPEVKRHIQLYSAIRLQHSNAGFLGQQSVHSTLLNLKQVRSVCICITI